MGIMAGIGGLVGGLGGLFGGGSSMPQAPPMFNMPNMGQAANNAFQGIQGLQAFTNPAMGTLPFASQTFQNLYNNPFSSGFQGGANIAGGLGQNAAMGGFNAGGMLQGAGLGTLPFAGQLLQAGFDPQNALFGRTQQRLQDQTRAGLEARGLDNTPFGAGVEGQTMGNFNIDWQNNLLQRMMMGAQGAGGLLTQGGNLANLGTGMQNMAPGQFLNASMMPYGAFGQIGGDQNQAIMSLLSAIGGGQNIANVPNQDWLNYVSAGTNQQNANTSLYGQELNAQKQQFGEQMQLGGLLGGSLYGLGRSPFGQQWGIGGSGWSNMFGGGGGGGWTGPLAGAW